jgi:stearoyl-CoA desaturase (delta-9 desaturase)
MLPAWGGLPFQLTHFCGSRRFATGDDLTELWGWHNNHHAYPSSARHELAWY